MPRIDPKTVETHPLIAGMFEIDPVILARITRSMKTEGYHVTKPIVVWKNAFGDHGRMVVVDGHTRLAAALAAGIDAVPVIHRSYKDLDEVLAEIVTEQANRRNLTTGQIAASVVMHLDSGLTYPGQRNDLLAGYSAQDLADLAGCSKKTIDQLRSIVASGNEELLLEVRAGKLSVKAAYNKAKQQTEADAPRAEAPVPAEADDEDDEGEGERCPTCGQLLPAFRARRRRNARKAEVAS